MLLLFKRDQSEYFISLHFIKDQVLTAWPIDNRIVYLKYKRNLVYSLLENVIIDIEKTMSELLTVLVIVIRVELVAAPDQLNLIKRMRKISVRAFEEELHVFGI